VRARALDVRGADFKRRATKWRCPTGECKPRSRWIKVDCLHPLLPRESERSRKLYRSRGAMEREFGRFKHEWALLPLRVRGLDRVRLHVDRTIVAKLACALSRARAAGLPAYRYRSRATSRGWIRPLGEPNVERIARADTWPGEREPVLVAEVGRHARSSGWRSLRSVPDATIAR
jgi:hypothetical protein